MFNNLLKVYNYEVAEQGLESMQRGSRISALNCCSPQPPPGRKRNQPSAPAREPQPDGNSPTWTRSHRCQSCSCRNHVSRWGKECHPGPEG